MEIGPADKVFSFPHHPYTEALLSAVPSVDDVERQRIRLDGEIPSAANPPSGCVFHTRCPKFREVLDDTEREQCTTVVPPLELRAEGHFVACHFPEVRADIAAAEDEGITLSESPDATPGEDPAPAEH
jgi:oligopeptide/dipeptide ABC transporter ATP-binding protein